MYDEILRFGEHSKSSLSETANDPLPKIRLVFMSNSRPLFVLNCNQSLLSFRC